MIMTSTILSFMVCIVFAGYKFGELSGYQNGSKETLGILKNHLKKIQAEARKTDKEKLDDWIYSEDCNCELSAEAFKNCCAKKYSIFKDIK